LLPHILPHQDNYNRFVIIFYIDYDTNKNYGTATNSCAANIFIDTIVNRYITSLPSGVTAKCVSTNTGYAISANLLDGGGHWCVDYKGSSRKISAALGDGIDICP